MSDHPRRPTASAAPTAASPSIPPPPPLPPPRLPQATARSAFARFVTQPFSTYGSRPASAQTNQSGGRTAAFPQRLPGFNPLNPLSSQHASFRTKVSAEIAALDINHDRTHAILAGREILETVRIDGVSCTEETNIREAIVNHDRHNATRHRDNLDIHDVKWSHGAYSNIIACAATNGKVVLYDLHRPGIELARLHEHHRQVHKVAFGPHQPALLLSASQDATVKLWDLRDMRSDVMTCQSRTRFMGQSEGIRDVRWSPADVLEFAFGTDGGVIQRWDHRNPKSAKLKINAHETACTAVDWHPDGKHLISAGRDKTLKVWDFSSEQRRQKPAWTLRTPYSISNARWRPPCWSGDDQGKGSWQCTQVVTSYERQYAAAHLWDFRRPYMPFREMWTSKTAPTDMLWHSIDLLWSVGRDGDFHQTDVKYTPKTIDRRPLSTFAISPTGEMVVFSQKRSRQRQSELEVAIPGINFPQVSRESGSNAGKPELSRSSADDSIDDSFLSSSYQAKHHERTLSNRSSKSIAGTPPPLSKETLARLNETLNKTKEPCRPQQVAYRGMLDGAGNVQTFSYLAQKYKTEAVPDNPTVDDFMNVSRVFEQNAKYAEKTGANRAAQTWRTFGAVLQNEVLVRAVQNRRERIGEAPARSDKLLELPNVMGASQHPNEAERVITAKRMEAVGAQAPELYEQRLVESSSQVPTPIARPQQTSLGQSNLSTALLPNPDHDGDRLALPPSLMSRGSQPGELDSKNALAGSEKKNDLAKLAFEGPSWYSANDLNERKAMMATWRAPPKALLELDAPREQTDAINIPPPLDRHNSDESFAMFSASSDSKGGPSIAASFNSARSLKQSMGSIPENRPPVYQETFSQYSSGSTGASQTVSDSGHSSSSKEDMFNASFGTPSLSESPLGTRTTSMYELGSHDNLEASGTIIPEEHTQQLEAPTNRQHSATTNAPTALQTWADTDVHAASFTLGDFMRNAGPLPEHSYPITAGKLVERAFMYSTGHQPDPQHVFHLITLLKKFLSSTTAIRPDEYDTIADKHLAEIHDILREYAHYCKEEIGLNTNEIHSILSDHLAHLTRFLITPWQVEAICTAYQEQLERTLLFTASTVVRNLLYPSYGAFRENLLQTCGIGLVCLKCNKPINSPNKKCGSCGQHLDPCPICWQKYSPFTVTKRAKKMEDLKIPAIKIHSDGTWEDLLIADDPRLDTPKDDSKEPSSGGSSNVRACLEIPVLWQFCMSCGHGAHAACLQHQQKIPELGGRCPFGGCDCACIPGPYRDKVLREEEEERARLQAGSVRGDRRSIGESGAVKSARGLLGEEGKRVRLVEPEK